MFMPASEREKERVSERRRKKQIEETKDDYVILLCVLHRTYKHLETRQNAIRLKFLNLILYSDDRYIFFYSFPLFIAVSGWFSSKWASHYKCALQA